MREEVFKMKYGWKFIREDVKNAHLENFDDSHWREVRVPHDYAIEGPFHPDHGKQITEVIADGILKPRVHVDRTGALPITEKAWYRKKFFVQPNTKKVFLEFDGVMSNSKVYVNGHKYDGRVYGYSSFSVDVSDSVKRGQENTLAVSVSPEDTSSRWYTGAGIYREVRLIEKADHYFPYCPLRVTTEIKNNKAFIDVEANLVNPTQNVEIEFVIMDREGKIVGSSRKHCYINSVYEVFKLNSYRYWGIWNSYLYTITARILIDNKEVDSYQTRFGIRTIEFDSNKGFMINGTVTKIKGVCMHHDLGALGAAFNKSAAERQIEKLIQLGVNGYRCAHNPPAPEVLDLCDEYGLVVMDEAYDEWQIKKVKNGYGKHFDKWAKKDLTDMIRRDRNHPSVIMWSIGNEILEQREEDGYKIARYLHRICKQEDPTRPTTAGLSMTEDAFRTGVAFEVDLAGVNYKPHLYEQLHMKYPNVILYGSETGSTVSSRGYCDQTASIEHPIKPKSNLKESSFDLGSPNWAYPYEREFLAQDQYPFVFGEFVWTGFDYIGEPTPYRNHFPARSSYFGIYDSAGMEKDRVYSFKSKWTDEKFIHLMPHWNWEDGDIVDVHAYSSCDKVELFLNDKSLGIAKKDSKDETKSHRFIWSAIPYEKGVLRAVSVDNPSITATMQTAREPYTVLVEPEKVVISADGDALCYIRCTIVDKEGTVCPCSDIQLNFSVTGPIEYIAADSGYQADERTFGEPYCKTLSGKCMVIIRSIKDKPGTGILTVTSELGTQTAEIDTVAGKVQMQEIPPAFRK